MKLDELFGKNIGKQTRELLEDFDVIATLQHIALVPRGDHFKQFRENVHAAVVTSTLGLASIDYAKRRYCEGGEKKSDVH